MRSPNQLISTMVASNAGDAQAPARGRRATRSRGRRDRRRAVALRGRRERARRARAATPARAGFTSTSWTSQPAMREASQATRQPTVPAPITVMRSPMCGRASHSAVDAPSRDSPPAPRGPAARSVGQHVRGGGRHHVARLVRDRARRPHGLHRLGPVFHDADVAVAVLHRARESRPAWNGARMRDHSLAGTRPPEHQRLGAAADAAEPGPDDDVASRRRRQRFVADLPASGLGHPERARGLDHAAPFCFRIGRVTMARLGPRW